MHEYLLKANVKLGYLLASNLERHSLGSSVRKPECTSLMEVAGAGVMEVVQITHVVAIQVHW